MKFDLQLLGQAHELVMIKLCCRKEMKFDLQLLGQAHESVMRLSDCVAERK